MSPRRGIMERWSVGWGRGCPDLNLPLWETLVELRRCNIPVGVIPFDLFGESSDREEAASLGGLVRVRKRTMCVIPTLVYLLKPVNGTSLWVPRNTCA